MISSVTSVGDDINWRANADVTAYIQLKSTDLQDYDLSEILKAIEKQNPKETQPIFAFRGSGVIKLLFVNKSSRDKAAATKWKIFSNTVQLELPPGQSLVPMMNAIILCGIPPDESTKDMEELLKTLGVEKIIEMTWTTWPDTQIRNGGRLYTISPVPFDQPPLRYTTFYSKVEKRRVKIQILCEGPEIGCNTCEQPDHNAGDQAKAKNTDDGDRPKPNTDLPEESKDTIPINCAVCYKPSKERCAGCREVKYCGTECQKRDWPAHKWFCQLVYPKKNPDVKSVRAILLPVDSPCPRFVQVPYQYFDEAGNAHPYFYPSQTAFFGDEPTANRLSEYRSDDGSKKRMLTVYFDDAFLINGSSLNECVVAITKSKNANYWRGPIIIYDSDDAASVFTEDVQYVDMRKQDCRHIIEFFMEERNRMSDDTVNAYHWGLGK